MSVARLGRLRRLLGCLLLCWCLAPLGAATQQENGHQQDVSPERIAKLHDMLAQPGADGRDARETAVEQLLAMPSVAAHRELTRVLARNEDGDDLRLTILHALARHLVGIDASRFGGADAATRLQIVASYLSVTSRWWLDAGGPEPSREALRQAALPALQRIAVREVEQCLRSLLTQCDAVSKIALFGCLADLQHLYLSQLLADYLEDEDAAVRAAARRSLRLLTFHEKEFTTRAEFAQWFEQNGQVRYVDLAQRAARAASQRTDEVFALLDEARIARSRDVVKAHVSSVPGIDWAAIQKETLVPDPAFLQACLQVLQEALPTSPAVDDASPARQAFCRSLLDRWRATPVEDSGLRARLLEVAAYTARTDEADLAAEVQGLLISRLSSPDRAEQLASLRGLRRFPSDEARAAVVGRAQVAANKGASEIEFLQTAIATMASRTTPSWSAPLPTAPDKSEWLALIQTVCGKAELVDLRDAALDLAMTMDSRNERLPEVFDLLLSLMQDTGQSVALRNKCVIHLQPWKNPLRASAWVAALHRLLGDQDATLRVKAAQAIGQLVNVDDARERKDEWLTTSIDVLRRQLATEKNPRVFEFLVESMIQCGSEPQMPGKAIAAVNGALEALGSPVPEDQKPRQTKLLNALIQIASDPDAKNGIWLDACEQLLASGNPRPLRLLLDEKHSAVDMARDVSNPDPVVAGRARQAMQILIRTALLKPASEPWKARLPEAHNVKIAFTKLEPYPESQLDEPVHRVLRLEVELATEAYTQVLEKANAWLTNNDPAAAAPGGTPWTARQKDRVRLLAAEAQLGQRQPGLAVALLRQCDPNRQMDTRELDLVSRIAKALPPTEAAEALALLDRVRKATPADDPAFPARLMDWAMSRLGSGADARAEVWAAVEPHAALFMAQDCKKELREAFERLRDEH
ncbi:MAG: hypothetical protein KDC98_15465 [Planctomycetes bacterium]|nr:hypothetical protein [Planctomycetota bacterium]